MTNPQPPTMQGSKFKETVRIHYIAKINYPNIIIHSFQWEKEDYIMTNLPPVGKAKLSSHR